MRNKVAHAFLRKQEKRAAGNDVFSAVRADLLLSTSGLKTAIRSVEARFEITVILRERQTGKRASYNVKRHYQVAQRGM